MNIVRTRKSNEDITPIQKKPNVSVSRTQNAVLCSNHRSVQQGKNIVITVGDSIKTGQNVILEISDSLQENQYVLADNKRDSIIKKILSIHLFQTRKDGLRMIQGPTRKVNGNYSQLVLWVLLLRKMFIRL